MAALRAAYPVDGEGAADRFWKHVLLAGWPLFEARRCTAFRNLLITPPSSLAKTTRLVNHFRRSYHGA